MEVEEGVIRRGRRPRRITPYEISIILHIIRKPNSIIVLLYIQDNSEEGVIRRGRRPRRITPSEISIILHIIRKPNSIIVLLYIQDNS